jgi:hypothetical protein
MNFRLGVLIGLLSSAVCLGLLFLAYPWSIYYGNFNYGWGTTAGSYLLLAFLVGLIGAILVGALSFFKKMPSAGQCILAGVLSFVALSAGSILLGPGGLDLVRTRVSGIFFSEWKFVTFDLEVALPISILNAGIVWWSVRRNQNRASRVPS